MAISMGGLPGIRLPGEFVEGPRGIPLYVESHGDPSALTRILLVHGGLQSCLCYQRQVAALVERGCYVVIPDLPWHGFSGPGPEQHEPIPTPEILGESLAAVCSHFDLNEAPLLLLAWSFGGLVIRSFLLNQRPSNIAGLVFVAALLDFDTFMPIAMGESAQVVQSFQRLATPGTPMPERFAALQDFVDLLWHRPPAAEEYYRVPGYNFRCFATWESILDILIYGTQTAGDIHQVLRSMGCPILFVQGQNDRLIPPAYTRQLAAVIPSALVEMAGCGHSPFLERSSEFNDQLLRFIEGKLPVGISVTI